jgi:hypothetical protein
MLESDDATLKHAAYGVLSDPLNPLSLASLVRSAERATPGVGQSIRRFVDTGEAEDGIIIVDKDLWIPQWPLLRLLSDRSLSRFGLASARRVLPVVQEAFPSSDAPRELLESIESFFAGSQHLVVVSENVDRIQNVASRVDREWDAAFNRGDFDDLTRRQIADRFRPVNCVEVVLVAGRMILATSRLGRLRGADTILWLFLQLESAEDARSWQLSVIESLLEMN